MQRQACTCMLLLLLSPAICRHSSFQFLEYR